MSGCIWRGSLEPRAIRNRHDEDGCVDGFGDADESCRGCAPCDKRHCVVCGIEHSLDQTCPTCLAAVREDLDAISDCIVRLHSQALSGSTLSGSGAVKPEAASEIPGGEAAVEIGPWSTGDAAVDRKQRGDENVRADATISHTLASWSQDWTESAGGTPRHPMNDDHVSWAAKHHGAFDDFAREMRQSRSRIEDMVHAGVRNTLGAPCFVCRRPLEREWGANESEDRWWCERCRKHLGVGEYVTEVGKTYRRHADWLTAEDIETTYQVPAGTVRYWASPSSTAIVGKKNDPNTGRTVYNVSDCVTRRDGVSA